MLKALADRLAEAGAEHFHERVRRELWGYAAQETLTNEQLVREEYRGIRPAPGYPACPDHTEKAKLVELLDVERNAGIRSRSPSPCIPTAAVSGWYIGHPQAHYFALGKIDRDQVEDYAQRKGMSVAEAERWLAPNLGYDAVSCYRDGAPFQGRRAVLVFDALQVTGAAQVAHLARGSSRAGICT